MTARPSWRSGAYRHVLIEDKRRAPAGDLISELAAAEDGGL
ncbi:cytochrome P450 [Actinocorallia sp. API 0066]|nr:cytochrome P450 [Actinocorallia sp. API 0066]MCD0449253.1 cytochrome P450 [Actinocorallia sp. API 0066]